MAKSILPIIGSLIGIALIAIVVISVSGMLSDTSHHEKTCTVSYDLNGGTGYIPPVQEVPAYASIEYDFTQEPTKEGWAFDGWSTTKNSSLGGTKTPGSTLWISGDTVIYAQWKPLVTAHSTLLTGYENGFSYKSKYSDYVYNNTPSSGYKYVVAEITFTNHSYSDGYDPNFSDFKLVATDNLMYDYSTKTLSFNTEVMGKPSIYDVKLAVGGSYTAYMVFEIPKSEDPSYLKYDNSYASLRSYVFQFEN